MSKERLSGGDSIDIDVISRIAKENLLKYGNHAPTVIAVGSQGKGIGHLEGQLDTHEERARAMQILGKVFRKEGGIGELEKLFFVSEGWMSVAARNGDSLIRPSLDPNRIEIFLVNELDLQSRKTSLLIFELVRDEDQKLVEINPYEDEASGTEARSYLLEAFMQGYYSSVSEANGKHPH